MIDFTVEVLDFYPEEPNKKKSCFVGTLKIRIPEMGLTLMGIRVLNIEGSFKYEVPSSKTICHKTHKSVRFPHIAFESKEAKEKFIGLLMAEAPQIMARDAVKYAKNPRKIQDHSQAKKQEIKPAVKLYDKNKIPSFDKEYIDLPPLKSRKKCPSQ